MADMLPPFEYRVTKYDPAFRDARGAYTRVEWTSVGDIGTSFGGVVLTEAEYQRVEDAYIAAALGFRDFLTGGRGRGVRRGHFAWPSCAYPPQQRLAMKSVALRAWPAVHSGNCPHLPAAPEKVPGFLSEAGLTALVVEGLENQGGHPLPFGEGSVLRRTEFSEALRRVLREEVWCRFEAPSGFVHVGYDYYMYIGVPQPCPESQRLVRQLGLFVEPFRSPYPRTEDA
jgi:hypothetical protein